MGWKISITCGGPIEPELLDSFLPGWRPTGETTDFHSATCDEDLAAGVLPNGMAVIVGPQGSPDLSSAAIELSARGRSGEFHMYSTTSDYEFRLYERRRIQKEGSTDSGSAYSGEDDDWDSDDDLAVELSEDGLWRLFEQTLKANDPNWRSTISMRVYDRDL